MIVNFKQQRIMKPIYNVWILMRITTRLAHSRAGVETHDSLPENHLHLPEDLSFRREIIHGTMML